jgi:lipopolysaccharide/colanic/teichoic acid biosynthesis glycosyltransferase
MSDSSDESDRSDISVVKRCPAFSRMQRSFIGRVLGFLTFMVSSFLAGLRVRRVDIVWGTSPPLFQGLTALLVARFKGVPFVFEIRDLWPDFAVQTGVLRNRLLISLSRALEHFLYRNADRLIVNSPGFIPHLVGCGVPEAKVTLVANGVEPGAFRPEEQGEAVRKELGIVDQFVVLYTGAFGLANDLGVLLEVAERLKGFSNIVFLLVGDGKEKRSIARTIAEKRLANVRLVPAQPKSRIPEYLAAADVCVAILKAIPMFSTTYPNKVFDYMAAGRPTVLAIDGAIRQVIEAAQGGTFACPGQPGAIAEAILKYAQDPELGKRHGMNARRYVAANFAREKQSLKLEQALQATSHNPQVLKRLLDVVGSAVGLVLLAPLLGLLALAVRVGLGSPVLFRQERVGLRGKRFRMNKFRTMTEARDSVGRLEPDSERLTGFGRFLRNWSLDELPTLFNVLKGDMSLVGPRPLLPEYVSRYTPEQARRLEVKPGVTGWAQVNGRNRLTWDERFKLDVWYVCHQSLALDFKILVMTLGSLLRREGIAHPGQATMTEFLAQGHKLQASSLKPQA